MGRNVLVMKRLVRDRNRILRLLGLCYVLRIAPLIYPAGYLLSGFCWRKLAEKTFHGVLLPLLFFLITIFSLVSIGASLKLNVYIGSVIVEPENLELDTLTEKIVFLYEIFKSEINIYGFIYTLLCSLTVIVEALSIDTFMKTTCLSKKRLLKITLILFATLGLLSILYIPLAYFTYINIEKLKHIVEAIEPTDMFMLRTIQEQLSSMLLTVSTYTLVTLVLSYYTHLSLAYLLLKRYIYV